MYYILLDKESVRLGQSLPSTELNTLTFYTKPTNELLGVINKFQFRQLLRYSYNHHIETISIDDTKYNLEEYLDNHMYDKSEIYGQTQFPYITLYNYKEEENTELYDHLLEETPATLKKHSIEDLINLYSFIDEKEDSLFKALKKPIHKLILEKFTHIYIEINDLNEPVIIHNVLSIYYTDLYEYKYRFRYVEIENLNKYLELYDIKSLRIQTSHHQILLPVNTETLGKPLNFTLLITKVQDGLIEGIVHGLLNIHDTLYLNDKVVTINTLYTNRKSDYAIDQEVHFTLNEDIKVNIFDILTNNPSDPNTFTNLILDGHLLKDREDYQNYLLSQIELNHVIGILPFQPKNENEEENIKLSMIYNGNKKLYPLYTNLGLLESYDPMPPYKLLTYDEFMSLNKEHLDVVFNPDTVNPFYVSYNYLNQIIVARKKIEEQEQKEIKKQENREKLPIRLRIIFTLVVVISFLLSLYSFINVRSLNRVIKGNVEGHYIIYKYDTNETIDNPSEYIYLTKDNTKVSVYYTYNGVRSVTNYDKEALNQTLLKVSKGTYKDSKITYTKHYQFIEHNEYKNKSTVYVHYSEKNNKITVKNIYTESEYKKLDHRYHTLFRYSLMVCVLCIVIFIVKRKVF